MARIVEQADGVVGLGKPFMEGPCRSKHLVAAGIDHFGHVETQPAQHGRHCVGIVHGVGDTRRTDIGGIADDQRDPLLRVGGADKKTSAAMRPEGSGA